MMESSISSIIQQLRVLNAATKAKHTQKEWEDLEKKYALMAYSDFGSDQEE